MDYKINNQIPIHSRIQTKAQMIPSNSSINSSNKMAMQLLPPTIIQRGIIRTVYSNSRTDNPMIMLMAFQVHKMANSPTIMHHGIQLRKVA